MSQTATRFASDPAHTSADAARLQAAALINWCDEQQYLRPTTVIEVQGDPLSVLARVAARLPEMTEVSEADYDALLSRIGEAVTEFAGKMTSGFLGCTIRYQDNADDLNDTLKDGEMRRIMAFTEDGQMHDTGIQGRDRHLTLGGGGYRVDDAAQFVNALSDRKHIMIELHATSSSDERPADYSLVQDMMAPVLAQMAAEPQTLRQLAQEVVRAEPTVTQALSTAPVAQTYVPEPMRQALAVVSQSGAIAPAMVEAFVPQQTTPVIQIGTTPAMEAPRALDTVISPQPVQTHSAQIIAAANDPQPVTIAQPTPARVPEPERIDIVLPLPPMAQQVMMAPAVYSGSTTSRAEASAYVSRTETPAAPAPQTVETKVEAPQQKQPDAPKAEESQKQDIKKENEKPEEKVAATLASPVIVTPVAVARPAPVPNAVAATADASVAPATPASVEQPRSQETPALASQPQDVPRETSQQRQPEPQSQTVPEPAGKRDEAPSATVVQDHPPIRSVTPAEQVATPPQIVPQPVTVEQRLEAPSPAEPIGGPRRMETEFVQQRRGKDEPVSTRNSDPVIVQQQKTPQIFVLPPQPHDWRSPQWDTPLQKPVPSHIESKPSVSESFGGCASCKTRNCGSCPINSMAARVSALTPR